MQARAILQHLIPLRSLIPVQREVAVDHAHAVVNNLVLLGEVVSSGVLDDRAAAAQFGEFSDKPGEDVLIGGLVADGNVDLNANSWLEARQGAASSTRRCSSAGVGIPRRRFAPSAASSSARRAALPDTYSSSLTFHADYRRREA